MRFPCPPGEGDTSDPVLATRQRLSLMPAKREVEKRISIRRLHPLLFPSFTKEERRRNAGKRWVPPPHPTDAARALLERARLTAFHHGSRPRELFHPKGSAQARLPGTRSERALPAFACPSPGKHLPSRSSCRETDTQAARERTANPPAGTAPAPPFGLPPEGVLGERDFLLQNHAGTIVKCGR